MDHVKIFFVTLSMLMTKLLFEFEGLVISFCRLPQGALFVI